MIWLPTDVVHRHRHGSHRRRATHPCWRRRANCWREPVAAHAAACPAKSISTGRASSVTNLLIADAIGSGSSVRVHVARACATTVPGIMSASAGTVPVIGRVASTGTRAGSAVRHVAVACTRLLARLVLTSIVLARLHGVATRGAAVPVGGASVAIRGSAAVQRVVLPIAVSPIAAIHAVAAIEFCRCC